MKTLEAPVSRGSTPVACYLTLTSYYLGECKQTASHVTCSHYTSPSQFTLGNKNTRSHWIVVYSGARELQ